MTPQELATESKCFSCIPDKDAVMIYLLDQIRILHGGSEMTVQEIQTNSKCFSCINDQPAAQTYLLDQILSAET